MAIAFVTPLRFVVSLALMSFRGARLLGAGPYLAGLAAVWVLGLITASVALLIDERFHASALAFAGWAMSFALLWLLPGLRSR